MADSTARFRHLTRRNVEVIATGSVAILGATVMMLFCLGFNPGWANGWPMGISRHGVFASFITIVFAVASISGAAAGLIPLCYIAERNSQRPFLGWTAFLAVLTLVVIIVLIACPDVYATVHAAILREWK